MGQVATWSARRWATAALAAVATFLAIGLPSDVIANPVFGRPVDVTWWSYPVLVVTALLCGLLVATYVREPTEASDPAGFGDVIGVPALADDELDRPGRIGGFGGLLAFFAVGCPTCNRLVVVAVGSSGALDWFAPAQPLLAILSLGLLGWALRTRLRNSGDSCRLSV
jgi:hypothetical protein